MEQTRIISDLSDSQLSLTSPSAFRYFDFSRLLSCALSLTISQITRQLAIPASSILLSFKNHLGKMNFEQDANMDSDD